MKNFLLLTISIQLVVVITDALVPAALVHTAVGFVAGSTGALAAYPIDYVKSQLQTEVGRSKYKGGFDAAVDIMREGGPFALYRGVLINIIGVAPEKTVKLGVNDFIRYSIMTQFGSLPLSGEIFAGGFAGMTQVIVTNPLEVVKVKMQTSNMTINEVLDQIDSLADLYQGANACIVRDIIFSAILFPFYAHTKLVLLPIMTSMVGDQGAPSFWTDLIAGSLSAGPSAFFSTPADVIKTRIQQSRSDNDPLYATGFFEVGTEIVAKEGSQVLFSGWFERVVRSVPQFGVTLAVFDVLNTFTVDQGWVV